MTTKEIKVGTIKNNRITIPSKLIDQMYEDDDFFREVLSLKKAHYPKFPKNDQWCSDDGFHMVFALAGYGAKDIKIEVSNMKLTLSSIREIKDNTNIDAPKNHINHGIINRGIARRSFKNSYYISEGFNTDKITASMSKGLLTILIPKNENILKTEVLIQERQ